MSVSRSCGYFGISRSAYYASCQSAEKEVFAEQIVIEMVQAIRHKMPRTGGRKLYHLLQSDLQKIGKIGRDKFFDLLRKNGLLVARKKSYTRTTDSYHRFHRYNNLLYNNEITRSNQCWVSDITYLRTIAGFVYLFLITDYYSRKIVGWSLSHSLSIECGLLALQMAVKQRNNALELIRHSDRGIQYCSNDYVNLLNQKGIQISISRIYPPAWTLLQLFIYPLFVAKYNFSLYLYYFAVFSGFVDNRIIQRSVKHFFCFAGRTTSLAFACIFGGVSEL